MCHNLLTDLSINDFIIDYSGQMFKVVDIYNLGNDEVELSMYDVSKFKSPRTIKRGFYVTGRWFASLFDDRTHPRDIKEIIQADGVSL